ncbi:hypothetical protein [Sphingomonas prati]|nr:hypothetical protein [Sphingomonas prati]GGE97581.1 hypothetical protein GCM10011404_33420 [Sphingomonas prati]
MVWEKKTEQVRVHMTPSDMKLLDAWKQRTRAGSRAEAARLLIFKALRAEGAMPDDDE